jgi:hypothetical protein
MNQRNDPDDLKPTLLERVEETPQTIEFPDLELVLPTGWPVWRTLRPNIA